MSAHATQSDRSMTVGEAADILGISRNRLKQLIQRGHLRPAETGADGGGGHELLGGQCPILVVL